MIDDVATCIGCGCTDLQACVSHGEPCHWLEVDYAQGVGVCSSCPGQLDRFKREHLAPRPNGGAVASLLHRFAGRLRYRLITIGGRPYLERHFLFKRFGVTAYLHHFVSSDDERNLHDHPWRWSFSVILAGGYTEERLRWFDPDCGWALRLRRMFPLRVNFIGARTFHRIVNPKPGTWTLFVHGPRVKGWGFLDFHREGSEKPFATYFQPYDPGRNRAWYLNAPLAREARHG